MNTLILLNGGHTSHNFFYSLAHRLQQDNHDVIIAVDCEASHDQHNISATGLLNYTFSEYFALHKTDQTILNKYGKYNLNAALLSDFERIDIYNTLGHRDRDYYEKLKSALLTFFSEIIEKRKINAVFHENVACAFCHFCWFVCQEYDVRYCGFTTTRLPGRFWITDDPYGDHLRVADTFRRIMDGSIVPPKETLEWCRTYIANIDEITPDYMKSHALQTIQNPSIVNRYFRLEKLKTVALGIRHLNDDHYHSFLRGNALYLSWQFFLRNLRRRLKLRKVFSYYTAPIDGEQFLLYPLHLHPESSTSVLSGTYLDELEVIRNIAFNLPQGFVLYVKDHLCAYGYPTLNFYKRLSRLPNVRLLSPYAPTKTLIRTSRAVITLTSTVGYEALLLNKRVFLFGEVFYQGHKNITKIENPTRLYDLFRSRLIDNDEPENDPDYNINFVAAYYMNTLSGTLNLLLDAADAECLVDSIYPEVMHYLLSNNEASNVM